MHTHTHTLSGVLDPVCQFLCPKCVQQWAQTTPSPSAWAAAPVGTWHPSPLPWIAAGLGLAPMQQHSEQSDLCCPEPSPQENWLFSLSLQDPWVAKRETQPALRPQACCSSDMWVMLCVLDVHSQLSHGATVHPETQHRLLGAEESPSGAQPTQRVVIRNKLLSLFSH